MCSSKYKLALVASAFLLGGAPAHAQTATERAGELKTWREQCNDPDRDLRQAYLEAAIDRGDVTIERICVRLALESDDADIQNLGLRAALASTPRITFEVQPPKELADAIAKAKGDERKMEEVKDWYVTRIFSQISEGTSFLIEDAEVAKGSSIWYPLVGLSEQVKQYRGMATVTGSTITWAGRANVSPDECRLNLDLVAGARLEGTFKCGSTWPFSVSAKLM